MLCKSCGKILKETDKFCSKCGATVEVGESESPVYDEVSETPVQDELKESSAYNEVNETPVQDEVNTAPAYAQVNETPVQNEVNQSSAESGFFNASMTEQSAGTSMMMNQQPGQVNNYGYQNGNHIPPEPQKKKKSPVGKIVAAVAGVAVVGVACTCVVNASAINNFVKKSFSSPTSYFQYVEEKQMKEAAATISNAYGNYLDQYEDIGNKSANGEITIELGAQARAMLEVATSTDMSFLEKASITYESGFKDSVMGMNLGMLISDKPVISIDTLFDMNSGMAYFLIPELSTQYLSTIMDDVTSEANIDMDVYSDIVEAMPDEDTIEDICLEYYTTAISCIDDVEKSNGTLEAGDISQSCTVLTATIDSESAQKIAETVLTKAKSDKNIENVIKDWVNVEKVIDEDAEDADTVYEEFIQTVDEGLASVGDITLDENITMTIWVNNKGDIVGRSVCAGGDEVKYSMPSKGKKVGFEASITAESENYVIAGSGKVSGNKLSGEYKIAANGTEYVNLEVKDYDVKKMEDGYLNGTFIVSMTPEASTALTQTSLVSNYDLQFDCTTSKDSSKVKISVLSMEQLFGAITITSNMDGKMDIAIPAADTVVSTEDEEALYNWISSIDWASFTAGLRESGVPSVLVDQIESATNELYMYGY